MRYTFSSTFHTHIMDHRDDVPAGTIDLSRTADFMLGYRDSYDQADPYVHSALITRTLQLAEFWQQASASCISDVDHMCVSLARLLIETIHERGTNLDLLAPTPEKALHQLFEDDLIDELRRGLAMTPFHVLDDAPEVGIIDLLGVDRLAMKMCPHLWMTPEEADRAHDDRIMGRTMDFTIMEASDVEGEEQRLSQYDEWAEGRDFPWESGDEDS